MKHFYFPVILLSILVCAGCSFGPARPEGFPKKLYPCELTITADGGPLNNARVSLSHQNETDKNWSSVGFTDAAGTVELYTYGKWKGVPQGTFKVTVSKLSTEGQEERAVQYSLVNSKFSEPETTPLLLEVKGKTTQTFDVGKTVKQKVKS